MAIAYDSSASGSGTGTSLTVALTVSGSNRMLIVMTTTNDSLERITGVTYNGAAMTSVVAQNNSAFSNNVYCRMWRLIAPDTGTNNIVVSASASISMSAYGVSLTGVSQVAPEASASGVESNSTPLDFSITTVADNAWIIDGYGMNINNGSLVPNSSQTERQNIAATDNGEGSINTKGPITPAASTNNSESYGGASPEIVGVAVSIAPATETATVVVSNSLLLGVG